jgi:autotransporter-associated beta strand protein
MMTVRRLFGSLALLVFCLAHAAEINFTSPAFEVGRSANGNVLTTGFTFSLGSFGAFTPAVGNQSQWQSNFTSLGSIAWDDGFTQYSQTATVSSNAAPFATTSQGYVWGYNSQTYTNGSEWLLLTNTAWTFPLSTTLLPVTWDASDAGTTAIVGLRAAALGADPYLKTALVSAPLVITGTTVANLTGTAGGAISQSGTLTISGLASLKTMNDSGAPITLDADANTFGSISAQVRNAADTANAVAAINIRSTGPMTLAGVSTGGSLTLVSNGGAITQTDKIVAGGATSITAGAAAVTLNHASNDFVGALSISNSGANNVSVKDANALSLGNATVGGTLAVTAPGGISATGNISAGAVAMNDAATLSGGAVTTSGNQTYSRAVTLAADTTLSSTVAGVIEFVEALIGGNYALTLDTAGSVSFVSASGLASLTKSGSGTMTLSGQSTYTGTTILSAGTLSLGTNNALLSTSPFRANGGTLALNGRTQTLGLLTVAANSVFNFGGAGGTLTFGNSSAQSWGGTLTITNYNTASNSLRFGGDAFALTSTQLSLIRFADYGNATAQIDALGLVTPSAIPEPATYAMLTGLCALGLALWRRKRA